MVPSEKTYGQTLVFELQTSSIKSNHTEVMPTCSESLGNQGLRQYQKSTWHCKTEVTVTFLEGDDSLGGKVHEAAGWENLLEPLGS